MLFSSILIDQQMLIGDFTGDSTREETPGWSGLS